MHAALPRYTLLEQQPKHTPLSSTLARPLTRGLHGRQLAINVGTSLQPRHFGVREPSRRAIDIGKRRPKRCSVIPPLDGVIKMCGFTINCILRDTCG